MRCWSAYIVRQNSRYWSEHVADGDPHPALLSAVAGVNVERLKSDLLE
jgi:hypothetical protein